MEQYFSRNLKKKKRLMKQWMIQKAEYRDFVKVIKALKFLTEILLGVWVLAVSIYIVQNYNESMILLKAFIRLLFGAIFYVTLRFGLKKFYELGKLDLGAPYYQRKKEFLKVTDNKIYYGYHDMTMNEESMMIYKIPLYSIREHHYDEKTGEMTIVGSATFDTYINYKKRRKQGNSICFRHNTPFSFIFSFDNLDKFESILQNNYKI